MTTSSSASAAGVNETMHVKSLAWCVALGEHRQMLPEVSLAVGTCPVFQRY